MANRSTTSGSVASDVDLLVALDRTSARTLSEQLQHGLRDAIRTGRLAANTRLPSTRALASDLGVTRGLVVECYEQLQAEGYLVAAAGSGTIVAPNAAGSQLAAAPPPDVASPARWDLRPGVPDLANFPRRDWLAALRHALAVTPDKALAYTDSRGEAVLRNEIAAYLGRVRGASADPERIVACGGFQQARSLLFTVLRRAGVRRIAFEDPGQVQAWGAAITDGLEPIAIPVDDNGIRVDLLERADPDAVLVTPAHQFPTGSVLAPERRLALLDWARRRDAVILEDDYDAEFRYDREPIGCLQGLDPAHVAYAGSVSKALAPGLRLGWLLCPPKWIELVAAEKKQTDYNSPVFDQVALAELLRSGRYDRHLRRMRGVYRDRRDLLVATLAHHAPRVQVTGIAAGMNAVATLPRGLDERHVVAAALERSVALTPMDRYRRAQAPDDPALVIGFGRIGETALVEAISRVADLLN